MERKALEEAARRWANWWKDNWSRFVEDPALADVRLPAPKEEPSLKRFLTGPSMKVSGGESGMIVTAIEKGSPKCCLALGLNRTLDLPKELSNTNTGVLGRVNQEVLVLERARDKPNEPLDLGELVLQLVKNLKPGDAAPDFEIENLDGSSVRLADFRGKYLL